MAKLQIKRELLDNARERAILSEREKRGVEAVLEASP
jgi:hypothetical protein